MKTEFKAGKVTAVCLALVMAAAMLCSCAIGGGSKSGKISKDDAYELYLKAIENTKGNSFEIDSVSTTDADVDMGSYGKVPSKTTQTVKGKMVKYMDSDMAFDVDTKMTVNSNGSVTASTAKVVLTRDKVYVKTDGDTDYTVADRNDPSMSYVNDIIKVGDEQITKDVFEGATMVKSADGTTAISVHIGTQKYIELFKDSVQSTFSAMGIDGLTIKTAEMDVTFKIDKEGRMIYCKVDGNVKMDGEIYGIAVKIDSDSVNEVTYSNYGSVTVTVPG
jgi:hypothetical protein